MAIWARSDSRIARRSTLYHGPQGLTRAAVAVSAILLALAAITVSARWFVGPVHSLRSSTQSDPLVHEHSRTEEAWRRELERLSLSHRHEIERLQQAQAAETERLTLQHRQDAARLQAISHAEWLRLESHWREQTERLDAAWQTRLMQQLAEQQAFADRLRTEHLHAQQRLEASYRGQLIDMSARVTGMLDRLSELETSKQALVHSLGVKPPPAVLASAKPTAPVPAQANARAPAAPVTSVKAPSAPVTSVKAPSAPATNVQTNQTAGPAPKSTATTSSGAKPPNAAAASTRPTATTPNPNPAAGKSPSGTPSGNTPATGKAPATAPSGPAAPTNRVQAEAPWSVVGGQGGPMKWPPLFQPHETSLAEQLDDAAHRLSEMDLALASIQAQWRKDFTRIEQLPVALPLKVDFKISSGFGVRSDPFNGLRAMHEGVDLIARHGSPVLATASGVVTRSGRAGAHGQMIEIRHAEGWVTRYAHLSRRLVAEGERVERGDVIGHLGNTGRSSGAHLHYELEHHGRILDPLRALGSLAWRR